MQNEILHIYVDESGTTNLVENQIQNDFYVISALLIAETDLDKYKQSADEIVAEFVGTGELKSSNVGGNINRRARILTAIKEADFRYYCLVVDKNSIWNDSGLRYKEVFYKFLHRMFYTRIKQSFMGLNIVIDNYGNSEFMESFKTYLFDFNNLFNSVEFYPSTDIPLLQIADFIAGSVRRVYLKSDPISVLEIINYPSVPIEEWPPSFSRDIDVDALADSEKFDEFIRQTAIDGAKYFIENNLGSEDEELNNQALALRFLLFNYFEDSNKYIYRAEIAKYISIITDTVYTEPNVSAKLISKIRDAGILLVSTDKGIKIPHSNEDMINWIKRVDSQIVPYLKRVENARNELLIESKNEFDIVKDEIFPSLSSYLSNSG
ncbi:MAG: DUF3800 domain-containing protein [Labilibaculum sp.]|nr:DUF3800 domain-containing protein [Labilibaculum sp.]MBI9060260.1 DUF3800 domain-containing protein [Labilibaculum sp.]